MVRPLALILGCLALQAQTTPEAVYEQGRSYWNLSLQAFKELQKTAPDSAYAFALLGEERANKRQYTLALDAYQEAAKRMPELRGVHMAIAEVCTASGKSADAATAEAAERRLAPPDCQIEKLECDFSAGRFDEVVKAARLEKNPKNLYWLARAYRELAVQTFGELSNLPESADLHRVKAQLLREERRYGESIDEWRAALKLAPGDRKLQYELATALYLSQKYQTVLPELQQLLATQPDSANLNFFVGDGLLETEHTQEAVPYLETALKLDPKLVPAHMSLGLCYARLDQPQKAIPHLKIGLELDKTGRLYYLLSRAYRKTGQLDLAKSMLEKYQELQKTSTSSGQAH